MCKMRSLALLLALLLVMCPLAAPAYAQDLEENSSSYVATVYNERNGLPTGEANAILQTSDGYIWVGSYGGLIRYDGSNFRNYSTEGKLPSASVRSLFEDSEGRLWIGTNDAGVFYMENDEILPVEKPADNSFLIIRDFAEGYSNTIYVASNSGMAMIHGGVLTPCHGDRIEGETVYTVGVDSYGRVWGRLNSGKCAVVQDNFVIQVFDTEAFFDDGQEISCAASDAAGNIYLGSSGNEVLRLSFTGDSLEISDITVEHIDTQNVSSHNKIIAADDGRMSVCGNYGMCVIEADGSILSFDDSDYASAVNDAIIDYEGNIWFGTTSNGTVKYTKGCFESPNKVAGLEEIAVNAVVKQLDGYYVATDAGVTAYDADWRPVENAFTEIYGEVRVRSLLADSDGGVWVASYDPSASVGRYDPATDTVKAYGPEDGILSSKVRSLLELSDGRIAVGTQEGLNVIKDGEVVQVVGVNDGLEAASTLCILESYDGKILVGSDGNGIYEIDGDSVINHGFNEGLAEGAVLRMLADPEGNGYFVSAGDSLYYFDGASYEKLAIQKGMGGIFDLYLRDGKLWTLQNSGIRSYDRAALLAGESPAPTEYTFAHGLTGSINANTWNCLDEDGTLYVSTRNGVSIFRFREVPSAVPKGIISSVIVDGEVVENPTELVLSANANRMTVDFAALSFTDTAKTGIRYWLEGFAEDETELVNEKSGYISYTNLPGGEYNFHLTIFDPNEPDASVSYEMPISKAKKLQEHPILLTCLILFVLVVCAVIITGVVRTKIRGIQAQEKSYHRIAEKSLKALAKYMDDEEPGASREKIAEMFAGDGEQLDPQIIPNLLNAVSEEGASDK